MHQSASLAGGFKPSETYESIGMIIANIWENKKCSKPPIRSNKYSTYTQRLHAENHGDIQQQSLGNFKGNQGTCSRCTQSLKCLSYGLGAVQHSAPYNTIVQVEKNPPTDCLFSFSACFFFSYINQIHCIALEYRINIGNELNQTSIHTRNNLELMQNCVACCSLLPFRPEKKTAG